MLQKNAHITIDSLTQLENVQKGLSEEIIKSEEKLSTTWHKMFHEQTPEEKASPTQRALNFISSSAGVIDGLILGWKLYHKFRGTTNAFSFLRHKKKK